MNRRRFLASIASGLGLSRLDKSMAPARACRPSSRLRPLLSYGGHLTSLEYQAAYNRALSTYLETQCAVGTGYMSGFFDRFYDPHLDPRRLPV